MEEYPRLRPLEAIPDPQNGRVILRDPTQLAQGMLVIRAHDLTLFTLLDGSRRRLQIQSDYARQTGNLLVSAELDALLDQLAGAGYLEGPHFETYYSRLVEEYTTAPHRPLRDRDSFGAPSAELHAYLDRLLEAHPPSRAVGSGSLRGIVVPHLDFPRGQSCYGEGYGALRASNQRPGRVVILATNHFGRSRSVVATRRDFETPWGIVPTDRAFLKRLEMECAADLFPFELDHLREHSVELQVIWLHHLLGDGFSIVPVLCPDPSGPRGTRAGDAEGADLRKFSQALGRLLEEDPTETLVVASADLSHIGGYFGDERELSTEFLQAIREADQTALSFVDRNDPEGLRTHMAATRNPTRVCSVGCLYSLMIALGADARLQRLRYHQAVTPEIDNAVTCAAYRVG